MSYRVTDYLDITPDAARAQWRDLLSRPEPAPGKRQVDFIPIESLLCLAAMLVVDGGRFGSGSAHRV